MGWDWSTVTNKKVKKTLEELQAAYDKRRKKGRKGSEKYRKAMGMDKRVDYD
jgi:hypothetical protein